MTEIPPRVSAILLTIGEKTFEASRLALMGQTLPLEQIIIVRNTSPFSAAFNAGISQVMTPYFIQCDADMILDRNCVEILCSNMTSTTGMVIGGLRDPLQGAVFGIKLYRTDLCKLYPYTNSYDCEYAFHKKIESTGWTVQLLNTNGITLGIHRNDLSDTIYNFERFKYVGMKIGRRKSWYNFTDRLVQFARSDHNEIATMGALAMISGFFILQTEDHLRVYQPSPEYCTWEKLNQRLKGGKYRWRVYLGLGSLNFFIGYWDGLRIKVNLKELNVGYVMHSCLTTDQLGKWAYFLGLCCSVMNLREGFKQNCITRFIQMCPFLDYLKIKLNYHINME